MQEKTERNKKICKRCLETLSYPTVAKEFKISAQRVHEIWFQYNKLNPQQTLINKFKENGHK